MEQQETKERQTITSGSCDCDNPKLVVCEYARESRHYAYVLCRNCQRHNDASEGDTALEARADTLNNWNSTTLRELKSTTEVNYEPISK